MSYSASKFIQRRTNPLAHTSKRINEIINYIKFCHEILLSTSHQYSRSWIRDNTSDKLENYLKKQLVHNYLKKYKKEFLSSSLDEILFECEPEMPYNYYDADKNKIKEANDKIDIKVNRLGLQNVWSGIDDQDIYFAVECKRLKKLGDNSEYIKDIEKFCNREYPHFRLPFEGMIAFLETEKIEIISFALNLNSRLKKNKLIITKNLLKARDSNNSHIYLSKHARNFNRDYVFTITHLYLNYNSLIVD